MSAEGAEYPVQGTFVTTCRFRLTLIREEPEPFGPELCAFPAQAARFLHRITAGLDREAMGALLLDTRNHTLGHTIAYIGTLSRAVAEPRGILVPALLANAAGVIVFHNHPSGDPTPSAEDLAFTRRLSEAADTVGVRLVDHLILGDPPAFLSLRERGGW